VRHLTDEELDRIVDTEAGIWPDFWSRETIKRVIEAGANAMRDTPEHGCAWPKVGTEAKYTPPQAWKP
jgi:hypothetical protein